MTKITFENLPSTNTPLNASNMNTLQTNVENAITTVEGAVTTLSNTVSDMQPVVLYNNTSGTNGDVTLSQSSANFTYMDIFYGRKPSSRFSCNVI